MKQIRFLHASAIAVSMALLLVSCSSGGEKQSDKMATTDTTATDTSTAMQTPQTAPEEKPGNVMIVEEKGEDYAKGQIS